MRATSPFRPIRVVRDHHRLRATFEPAIGTTQAGVGLTSACDRGVRGLPEVLRDDTEVLHFADDQVGVQRLHLALLPCPPAPRPPAPDELPAIEVPSEHR